MARTSRPPGTSLPDGHSFKNGCVIFGMKRPGFSGKPSDNEEPKPSTKPDLSPFEVEVRKSLEESLHRLYEPHTGQPWRDDEEDPKPDLSPFEQEVHRVYESAMWDRYEEITGNKRPEGAPKIPEQDDD